MSDTRHWPPFPRHGTDAVAQFSQHVFSSLSRADQRRWAEVYLRGLMCVDGKKSLRRIAESLVPHPAVQSLQQFLNQSPWDWNPVCRALHDYVSRSTGPAALSVGVVHIVKRGSQSVGVRRRFVREADKLVNAQIGVGLFLTSRTASIPVSWRIVLDGHWGSDKELRKKVLVPDDYRVESEGQAILSLLDDHAKHADHADPRHPKPLLADLRGVPGVTQLMARLSEGSQEFLIEVDGAVEVHEAVPRRGHENGPVRLRALCASPRHRHPLGPLPVDGPRGRQAVTALVRLAGHPGPVRGYRVIAQLPSAPDAGARYWITNVVDRERRGEVTGLILLHAHHKAELDDFRSSYGVADFEGRSFLGWQHHMTLSSAAFAGNRLVCEPMDLLHHGEPIPEDIREHSPSTVP